MNFKKAATIIVLISITFIFNGCASAFCRELLNKLNTQRGSLAEAGAYAIHCTDACRRLAQEIRSGRGTSGDSVAHAEYCN